MERESGMHAVLFYGAEGSGKEELARILAQYWLCKNPDRSTGADETCQACGAFSRNTNPDLLVIAPIGAGNLILAKQFEAAPNPKEDDPIPMFHFLRTGPVMSRHKVVLISDAHRMNETSSNSLLKTLEEPHPYTKLILTTPSIGAVRPTILSRCLATACSLPTKEELKQVFPSASDLDFVLSESAPGRLKQMAKSLEHYRAIAHFARSLVGKPGSSALTASEEFRGMAEKLEGKEGGQRAANAEALALFALVLTREPGLPAEWAQEVAEAHRRILGNASAGIVFDALFAKLLL